MSYTSALAALAPVLGKPPAGKAIGAPPPPSHADVQALHQSAEPPAYDVAKDPGWAPFIHPEDRQIQGVLNAMSPEDRQLIQSRLVQLVQGLSPKLPAQPGGVPVPPPSPPAAALPPQV